MTKNKGQGVDLSRANLELLFKPVNVTAASSRKGDDGNIYLITSLISRRNECFVVDNVETKIFVKKENARVYMEKRAKALFFGSVLLSVDYDEKESVVASEYSPDYYYNDDGDYIDYGCRDHGYRSSLVNWGFVRMERMKLLSAEVYTQQEM